MTLGKRALSLIFPVVLAGYVLAASLIYYFQSSAILGLERARLWQQMGLRVGVVLLLAVVVGVVESVMARLRMERVAYLLGAAAIMGMLTLILTQAR